MGFNVIDNNLMSPVADNTGVKEKPMKSLGASDSFASKLQAETKKKCPYNFLAKDGVINYKGVTFLCDYEQNAITLGNMYEKDKVIKIALPSGSSLHVNIDNIDQLAQAADMFTPEDLNAIMRAIHEYNHCTRKRYEIEEEKSETIDEAAENDQVKEEQKEPEIEEKALISRINAYRIDQYYELFHRDEKKVADMLI